MFMSVTGYNLLIFVDFFIDFEQLSKNNLNVYLLGFIG